MTELASSTLSTPPTCPAVGHCQVVRMRSDGKVSGNARSRTPLNEYLFLGLIPTNVLDLEEIWS